VVTASVSIGALLASRHIRVTLLGGIIRREDLTLIGPLATQSLDRYRFDLAVVGTSALKVDEGLFDLNDEEAEINRLAVKRAQRLVVLVDSSKIGMVAWAHVAGCSSIHKIVTDENIRPGDAEALRAQGIDVIIATPTTAVSNLSID